MTNYYNAQTHFYDATRWMFVYGRETLIGHIDVRPGDRVLDIGCGTGKNFDAIQERLRGSGELIGVDCSITMLDQAEERIVRAVGKTFGSSMLNMERSRSTRGRADVVLFSYSLSMIPDWKLALACAHSELWPGGRIGVVDFLKLTNTSKWFSEWLEMNHVIADRPYEAELRKLFHETAHRRCSAWAGLWSFYLFVGMRRTYEYTTGHYLPSGRLKKGRLQHRALMAKHKSKVQYEHQPVTVDLACQRRWIKPGRVTRVGRPAVSPTSQRHIHDLILDLFINYFYISIILEIQRT
jgi:S-adenosylmethionine-diacylgycerolhomoserine-N-methlytransferase